MAREPMPEPKGEVVIRLWPGDESTAYVVEIPDLDPSTGEVEPIDLGAWLSLVIRRANASGFRPRVVATFPPGEADTWPTMAFVAFRTIRREVEIFDIACQWLEPAT